MTTITKVMQNIPKITHALINWRYGINDETALNKGAPPEICKENIAAGLKRAMNSLKARVFDPESGAIDYSSLARSSAYNEYRIISRCLQVFDPSVLDFSEERLAFWINLYNALTIDAVIDFGVMESVNEVPGFFWKAAYCINGYRFSAVDIEYGVVRTNIGHPGIPGPHFSDDDRRRIYSLRSLDPRTHFALVCASRSCPPISFYSAEQLDRQLDLAASSFINNGGVEIDRQQEEIRLSKIFQWYAPDFGGPLLGLGDMNPVLDYIAPYLDRESNRKWITISKPKVKFLPYDWRLNI